MDMSQPPKRQATPPVESAPLASTPALSVQPARSMLSPPNLQPSDPAADPCFAPADRQRRTAAVLKEIQGVYPNVGNLDADTRTGGSGNVCFSTAGELLEGVMKNVFRMTPNQQYEASISEVQFDPANLPKRGPSFANFRVTSDTFNRDFNHSFNVFFDEGNASVIQSYVDKPEAPTVVKMTSAAFATRLGDLKTPGRAAKAYGELFGVNVPDGFTADAVGMTSLGEIPAHAESRS